MSKRLKISKPFEMQAEPLTYIDESEQQQAQQTKYTKNQYAQNEITQYLQPSQIHQQTLPKQIINAQFLSDIAPDNLEISPQKGNEIKQRKKLTKTTTNFQVDQSYTQQAEEQVKIREQEKKKKEEEAQLLLEVARLEAERQSRLPKTYSIVELQQKFDAIEEFVYFEQHQFWSKLKDRQCCATKEIQRRDQRVNTTRKDQREHQRDQRDLKESREHKEQKETKFEKGTNLQKVEEQQQQQQQVKPILITRVTENIEQKQKKDEMKQLAEAWKQQLSQNDNESSSVEKIIKYKLNQLATENYPQISSFLIETIVENQHLTDHLAEKIIEKSQIEPKYRSLYTKLCVALSKEPRLQEIKNNKQVSLFRSSLLNKVQEIFQERYQKPNQQLEEQSQIIRKNKIMGNVRFIGDLYLQGILPVVGLALVIAELLGEYLCNKQEESLEGLIELIDQVAKNFKSQGNADQTYLQQLKALITSQTIKTEHLTMFLKKIHKFITLDFIMEIFYILKSNFTLSQRIELLIENLIEKQKIGWVTKKQVEIEEEEEESLSPLKQQKHIEEYSTFDLNEIIIFVSGSFNLDPIDQQDKLLEEIKRIQSAKDAQLKFFETFFQNFFSYKLFKQNLDRAQLIYELFRLVESDCDTIQQALKNVLNDDVAYNLIESPRGLELIVNTISYFLNDKDFEALNKLSLKLDLEDFNEFLVNVEQQLVETYSDDIDMIHKYFVEQLK